jgi:hypothetical protein
LNLKLAFLLFVFGTAALAQSSAGYVFIAPGGLTESGYTSGTIQMGAGGEGILGKGIGVGPERVAFGGAGSVRAGRQLPLHPRQAEQDRS